MLYRWTLKCCFSGIYKMSNVSPVVHQLAFNLVISRQNRGDIIIEYIPIFYIHLSRDK